MRTVDATMYALGCGLLVMALGGLLEACSTAKEQGSSTDGGAPGVGASGGSAGVGAAGSSAVAAGGTNVGYGSGGAAAGTGGSVAASAGGTGGGVDAGSVTVCNDIAAGASTLTVNGTTRTFSVQLPADTSHMALLFLWHGWLQVPTDFANAIVYDVPSGKWVPFDPDAFPMPLMIVTPYDLNLIPPAGLDWDIASGAQDFPFFEAMLQCIQQQFSIDKTRIYSFGFSAGAVFSDLLSAKYPHLFAATVSESGAWFNDTNEWADVSVPIMQWQWPPFSPADEGNVLLTHGGPNDYATVISLEQANQQAIPFLYDNQRTVVDCAHTFGHSLDPDLTQSMYYEYLWDHQLGGPPLSAMIPDFPTQAKPVGATSCTFHPYP